MISSTGRIRREVSLQMWPLHPQGKHTCPCVAHPVILWIVQQAITPEKPPPGLRQSHLLRDSQNHEAPSQYPASRYKASTASTGKVKNYRWTLFSYRKEDNRASKEKMQDTSEKTGGEKAIKTLFREQKGKELGPTRAARPLPLKLGGQ